MIELRITGDTGEEFATNVAKVMALLGSAAAPVAEAPGKPTRKPKTEPASQDTDAAGDTSANVATEQAQETSSSGTTATSDASPSDDGPHTIDSVKKRAMLYTQTAGPQPLTEMLKLAGSADGKFSQITEQAQIDKVAAALAAAGF